jgi:FKBP-type peptidyl-prolyl cis-trans isomerase
LRFLIGDSAIIGAFNEAVVGMRAGGIRRIVVSPGPLFYPLDKPKSKLPKPSTFSGERALYFVLENQGLIDKTLLFDIELVRVEDA